MSVERHLDSGVEVSFVERPDELTEWACYPVASQRVLVSVRRQIDNRRLGASVDLFGRFDTVHLPCWANVHQPQVWVNLCGPEVLR